MGGAVAVVAREVGRALRRLGWTYGEIREVIPVPKSTLAGWCREIRLTDEQVAAFRARTASRRGIPRDTQRRRRREIERIRAAARDFATGHLHDPLFVAGTVLYCGEGAKTSARLAMSNADPAALRLFVRRIGCYRDTDPRFVLALHLQQGMTTSKRSGGGRRHSISSNPPHSHERTVLPRSATLSAGR